MVHLSSEGLDIVLKEVKEKNNFHVLDIDNKIFVIGSKVVFKLVKKDIEKVKGI